MKEEAKGNEGSKLEKSVVIAGKDLALNRNEVVDDCAMELLRVRKQWNMQLRENRSGTRRGTEIVRD